MARLLPPEQWFATLPTAYLTASGLITAPDGRVLPVEPDYREHWTLPGGVVEQAEELDGAAFLDPGTALDRMHPALSLRLAAALEARRTGRTAYVAT
ncbi:NUDIX hydrolase [Nocardiopsis potens]|uniref:hypothetical protein n=1 Tax=Nocardiopsis potens TaxID=1246458 RepID=UPI00034A218B|nr:hypothetical protein [Nocardiopsis potens]